VSRYYNIQPMKERDATTLVVKTVTLLWFLALLITLAACTKPSEIQHQSSAQAAQYELLSFIEDGVTTRAQVLEKLGTPSAKFEGDRILTYRIKVDEDGAAPVLAPWVPNMLSLVLVFDGNALLERHSLVENEIGRDQ
jgi:outer membrane protein assembly factor BamE (lipoprotein component of BamABCDE complex)